MAVEQAAPKELAHDWGRTSGDAFKAAAQYLRSLPDDAWDDPTGAAEWNVRVVANHITGEGVWFPNVIRGALYGETPLPSEIYDEMRSWPVDRLASALEEAGNQLRSTAQDIDASAAELPVDLGWSKLPVWRALYIGMGEAVYHGWDARAGRESDATIPAPWAVQLVRGIDWFGPQIARKKAAAQSPGTYLFWVADGIGPISVVARDGGVTFQLGRATSPADVTLHLTADQYVRLIAGRLKLQDALDRGVVKMEGDRSRALALTRIFHGIANGP
jgi:uncharacterized protein (TIGR03083 family)